MKQETPTTIGKVNVKGYTRLSGAIVDPHLQTHKLRLPGASVIRPRQPQEEQNQISTGQHNATDLSTIDAPNMPKKLTSGNHTSGVYTIEDDYGRTGYFKPKALEVWKRTNSAGQDFFFRQALQDDMLAEREVLASGVANLLGMNNSIPKTLLTHVTHKGQSYGEGSIQMDAKAMMANQEFTDLHMSLLEYQKQPLKGNNDEEREKQLEYEKTKFKNGGTDIAYFDFIIGNMDRHYGNLMVGTNPNTNEMKMIGIDHGLSFPGKVTSTIDFKNNGKFLNMIGWEAGDIECSKNFQDSIQHPDTKKNLQNLMSSSNLSKESQEGVLKRFQVVKDTLSKSGSLKGAYLPELFNAHIKD